MIRYWKWSYVSVILTIHILCNVYCLDPFVCPSGAVTSKVNCSNDSPCQNGHVCFILNNGYPYDGSYSFCCDTNHCNDTGTPYIDTDTSRRGRFFATFNVVVRDAWTTRSYKFSSFEYSIEYSCLRPWSALFNFSDHTQYRPMTYMLDSEENFPFNEEGLVWRDDGLVTLNTCQTNHNCSHLTQTGNHTGYCYYSMNIDAGGGMMDKSFCYKLRNVVNAEYLIKPDKKGFEFCMTHADCWSMDLSSFCFNRTNMFYSFSEKKLWNGICMKSRGCTLDYMVAPKNMEMCNLNDHSTCQGTDYQAGQTNLLSASCKSVNLTTRLYARTTNYTYNLCCFEFMGQCEFGDYVLPHSSCTTINDCNKNNNNGLFDSWCDDKLEVCCTSNSTDLLYCDDQVTPLHNQEKCVGYQMDMQGTGTCYQTHNEINVTTNGVCKYDHCCSGLKVTGDHPILGEFPFITNQSCTNISQYQYAYCDITTDKIVIIGRKNFHGQRLFKGYGHCGSNSDCDDKMVCVHMSPTNLCYSDPMIKRIIGGISVPIWISSCIGVLLVIVLVIGGTVYVLYKKDIKEHRERIERQADGTRNERKKAMSVVMKSKEVSAIE